MDKFGLTRLQQERLDDFDVLMLAELSDIIEDVALMDAMCVLVDERQYSGIADGMK